MCFECVHQSLSYLFLHVCPFLLKGRQRKPIAVATELLQTTSTRILWLKLRCQDGSQSSTPNIALNHSSRVTNIRGKHAHTPNINWQDERSQQDLQVRGLVPLQLLLSDLQVPSSSRSVKAEMGSTYHFATPLQANIAPSTKSRFAIVLQFAFLL